MSDEPRKITQEEWLAEGRKLFGDDPKDWRFVCPNCGNIQTIGDFMELRKHGIEIKDAQVAYFNCIGRYDTRIPAKKIGHIGEGKSPCDYSLGGLIHLHKTVVIDGDTEHRVFEFAEAA
jgi:hypothetical protein